ncbi:hypothetical protein HVX72_08090 [Citrobacter sp. RHB21-C05]|uniref:polysialyltransferase family glycosyltransferase n=2 Tax=Enterobacteriaceae TaxID=543 RepID=UPI0015E9F27C|nr:MULTISPECIES: polysialyltransferase family glycosyltransferase [Citrobacter]EHG7583945.1 hypothetical protein [Citrobacter sedlakii]MBN6599236.1 hypothetical protein [Citrobacter sedlakii]QMK45630.1 hypothetical protein HVX72_08090 [Citrobacter sp. RHB21-C05]QMK64074.1 hypothetical protein HVX68_08090 [Citrobacter sp. RHB21-C01]
MKLNYYFLWSYNKLPFVYSIMNAHEKNILIINTRDSSDIQDKLSHLSGLDKVDKVILYRNDLKEYILSILYRMFVYPFKNKREKITFYLDGCFGRYPILLANCGKPDNVIFYEEGEGTYRKDVLFKKLANNNIKYKVNELIKKMLFINKNSIENITCFYIRNKERLLKSFSQQGYRDINFEIIEVNDIECLRKISFSDKELLKKIFFDKFTCDFTLRPNEKRAVVLTQPTYLYGIHTKEELASLFNSRIEALKKENYKVYLKMHPIEREDIYIKDDVQRLNGCFPFELLSLFDVVFDKGLTFNSTAINSSLIKEKCIIQDEISE